jgi:hypothetical protein
MPNTNPSILEKYCLAYGRMDSSPAEYPTRMHCPGVSADALSYTNARIYQAQTSIVGLKFNVLIIGFLLKPFSFGRKLRLIYSFGSIQVASSEVGHSIV